MKALFLFLTILFSFPFSYSQGEPAAAFELAIKVKNNTFGDRILAEMNLASICWDANALNNNNHNITTSYPGVSNFRLSIN